jgi:CheY-like chemotaxis protein
MTDRKRAFLVEDEVLLLLMLEDVIEGLGYEVAATASSLEEGLQTVNCQATYDVAILDVNLSGERSFEIARRLRTRDVPVVFVTGYGRDGLNGEFADCPVVPKPYTPALLSRALEEAERDLA